MSEEQRKDRNFKITVGLILTVVIGLMVGLGPGLPKILEHARENASEPWAAERYYNIARFMQFTMREDQAMEVYDEMYLKWGGNDWEQDFEFMIDSAGGNEQFGYYFPWVMARYDGLPGIDEDDPDIVNRRPPPVSPAKHPIFGKVMIQRAYDMEGKRDYQNSDHLWRCLKAHWPPGSEEYTEGDNGMKRALQRQF